MITDSDNQIVVRKQVPYEQVTLNSYTDIDLNLFLEPGKRYYLSVELEADESGRIPVLKACAAGGQYYMSENRKLMQDEVMEGMQLVTRYTYRDAMSGGRILRAFLLGAVGGALYSGKTPGTAYSEHLFSAPFFHEMEYGDHVSF